MSTLRSATALHRREAQFKGKSRLQSSDRESGIQNLASSNKDLPDPRSPNSLRAFMLSKFTRPTLDFGLRLLPLSKDLADGF